MKRTAPSLFLPPLLLLLVLTYNPSISLSDNCSYDISISSAEDVANLTTVTPSLVPFPFTHLYVHPKEGMKGVSLLAEVTGSDELEVAYFPLRSNCFLGSHHWWVMYVEAKTSSEGLKFRVETGECSTNCVKSGNFDSVRSVQVKGYGASEWRKNPPNPDKCMPHVREDRLGSTTISCEEPPTLRASTPRQSRRNTTPRPSSAPAAAPATGTPLPPQARSPPSVTSKPLTAMNTNTAACTLPVTLEVVAAVGAAVAVVIVVVVLWRGMAPLCAGRRSHALGHSKATRVSL